MFLHRIIVYPLMYSAFEVWKMHFTYATFTYYCKLISSVHQWAARLYAAWVVEKESELSKPNDLG